jgi:hypothetical protein
LGHGCLQWIPKEKNSSSSLTTNHWKKWITFIQRQRTGYKQHC